MSETVYLTEISSGASFGASLLRNPSALRLQDTETVWRIAQRTLLENAQERGNEIGSLAEHTHWDWAWKHRTLKQTGLFFGIEADGLIQGLMLLRFDKRSRLEEQKGCSLVYIDYLETAPWNLPQLAPQPRFRGVGSALLESAVWESVARGWEGRVGLHSLPQSETFYRRMGLTALGTDKKYQSLCYFEMSPEQAIELLKD